MVTIGTLGAKHRTAGGEASVKTGGKSPGGEDTSIPHTQGTDDGAHTQGTDDGATMCNHRCCCSAGTAQFTQV